MGRQGWAGEGGRDGGGWSSRYRQGKAGQRSANPHSPTLTSRTITIALHRQDIWYERRSRTQLFAPRPYIWQVAP
ncbi:hypothetical protein E2C01_091566 [Portunus trituberculatus]|uniref:Uncharacterized protein n=1 Tax=Portunus trituberculatus TaxID=210409 RepID=A0A5B7JVD4_PORTR|nr:hypothetical protein [Portunus trituberculatus]